MAKNPISPTSEPVRFAVAVVAALAAVLTAVAPDVAVYIEGVALVVASAWARSRVTPVE